MLGLMGDPPTGTLPAGGCARILLRLAAGRDAGAWAGLLELVGPDIGRLARRILGEASLADDAVQETLLQVRDHAGRFVPPDSGDQDLAARGWILRIAANTSLNLLRQRRRAQARDLAHGGDAGIQGEGEPAPHERIERDETTAIIRRQVADLPELNREAVTLHFFGGLSYDALAVQLEVPVETAKKRVNRGLHALRRKMERAGCALSLLLVAGLLEQASAAEVEAPLAASCQGLLASGRSAGRFVLPAAGVSATAVWLAVTAATIIAAAAAVVLISRPTADRGTEPVVVHARPQPQAPPAAPPVQAPLPPGQRLDDADEWIGQGSLAIRRQRDQAAISTRMPDGDASIRPGVESFPFGSLRHRRLWKLADGPVSMRLAVDIPEQAQQVLLFGALLPDKAEGDWRSWPKLQLIFDGFGGFVSGDPVSSPLGSIMTYADLGGRPARQAPLFGDITILQPGKHHLELIVSTTGCWSSVDGKTLYRSAEVGDSALAEFYVEVKASSTRSVAADVRISEVELGPCAETP